MSPPAAVPTVPPRAEASPSAPASSDRAGKPTASSDASASDDPLAGIDAGEVVEIVDHSFEGQAERLQHSADAVNVVETRKAQERTADLGEVLARSQGVTVRRSAGLGSAERFSLNGLYDEQIRFFLDGVPLDMAGYPFGVANVPVNLIDRVEVYRGVVPIRFGADALGGAVNLVRTPGDRTRAAVGYQVGSFGTHRVTLDGHYYDPRGDWSVGSSAFLDLAKNDYPVEAKVTDAEGQRTLTTVDRFHDGYRGGGGTVELALYKRPWAKRLSIEGFFSMFDKDLQSNLIMGQPYGEVTYQQMAGGATLRYEVALAPKLDLEVVGNYAHRNVNFVDTSLYTYDWLGKRVFMRTTMLGEIGARTDQLVWQDSGFGRATVKWNLTETQSLRFSTSPTFAVRSGNERIQEPNTLDPLTAERKLFTLVTGVEHEIGLLDDRLANVAFVKDYVYRAATQEQVSPTMFRDKDRDLHRLGAGDSLRYRVASWLYAKASYEYATRMPQPDEVFGDGVQVHANLDLEPEVSHNANLGPRFELRRTPAGDFTIDINGFLRDSSRLVVLFGNDAELSYQNVFHARGLGIENAVIWTAPGGWLGLDGTLTYEDVRVVSDDSVFAEFNGDRIPNRPYLLGSWGAHVRLRDLPAKNDDIEPFYSGRYVHDFFRSWESQGSTESKEVIASQITHSLGVTWTMTRDRARVTTTFEIDNLTDAKVFDSFGAQRPGRAMYLKLTGEL